MRSPGRRLRTVTRSPAASGSARPARRGEPWNIQGSTGRRRSPTLHGNLRDLHLSRNLQSICEVGATRSGAGRLRRSDQEVARGLPAPAAAAVAATARALRRGASWRSSSRPRRAAGRIGRAGAAVEPGEGERQELCRQRSEGRRGRPRRRPRARLDVQELREALGRGRSRRRSGAVGQAGEARARSPAPSRGRSRCRTRFRGTVRSCSSGPRTGRAPPPRPAARRARARHARAGAGRSAPWTGRMPASPSRPLPNSRRRSTVSAWSSRWWAVAIQRAPSPARTSSRKS